jgi:hypothetical protein
MTILINLYGGPGTGKSTTAASIFADLKRSNINAELVTEYVKQWAWDNRRPVSFDQFYFFGHQSRREYSLFNKVDAIVTDSPVSLCAYYAKEYGTKTQAELFSKMYIEYASMCTNSGVDVKHIWLKRTGNYDSRGRFHSHQQALDIDVDMRLFMADLGIEVEDLDPTQEELEKFKQKIVGSING